MHRKNKHLQKMMNYSAAKLSLLIWNILQYLQSPMTQLFPVEQHKYHPNYGLYLNALQYNARIPSRINQTPKLCQS